MSARRASLTSETLKDIVSHGVIHVPEGKAPRDLALAQSLTKSAIEGIGEPVYASMTDHKPQDTALAQAQMQMAINKQGIKSVGKAPVDRAITEALTLNAIVKGKDLTHVDAPDTALTPEKLAELQKLSDEEKQRYIDAHTFGGGDIEKLMPGIFAEIQKGGAMAVPPEKANIVDLSLAYTKTMMEINSMKGEPIYASQTDGAVADKALENAKTQILIQKQTTQLKETPAAGQERATNEAHLLGAIRRGSATLKPVDVAAE